MADTYDVSLGTLVLDGQVHTERTQGAFLTISSKAVLAGRDAMGGKSIVDRVHAQDRAGTITCGFGSALHDRLGELYASQLQQLDAGAFDGFPASYRYAGKVSIVGLLVIAEEPEIVQGGSSEAWVWPVIWRETTTQYGAAA